MSYADEYTDEKLAALEKKVNSVYAKAYKDTHAMAAEYFKTLEKRYNTEYTAMMASTNTLENFTKWYKDNGGASTNDAAIKALWQKKQNTYTEASFKQWYATQVSRGERYTKMAENMAKRMTNANEVAAAYVNDETPGIYSLNRNYAAYKISEKVPQASFEIYNEQAVRNLVMNNQNVTEFKTLRVNPVRDYDWNSEQIRKVLAAGIIRGLSIDHLADEFLTVMQRNRSAAIRNARTAFTSAQNAGRLDTMQAAEKQGIKVVKQWHSMEDASVRFTHALLDGQIRPKDKPFSNGLMFPGDSNGAPAEVYNCRCRMEYILPDYMDDKSNESYDKWATMSQQEKQAEKKAYEAWQDAQLKMSKVKDDRVDYSKTVGKYLPTETQKELIGYAQSKNINLDNLTKFDGNPELLKSVIDTLSNLREEYPTKHFRLEIDSFENPSDFAITENNKVRLNRLIFRDRTITENNIDKNEFAARTLEDICIHEYGHVIANNTEQNILENMQKALYNVFNKTFDKKETLTYLMQNVSAYSTARITITKKRKGITDYFEIPSEMLVKAKQNDTVAREFMRIETGR